MAQDNIFEKHPKTTIVVLTILLVSLIYGLCSIKIINNQYTENEAKNIKTILKQYYFGKVIDNNVGRFIKLREHPPLANEQHRPTRNYIKNIPGQLVRKYYPMNIDQNGFIGPSEIHTDPDIKIVFLGGSTTECMYMEETERFPYLVGRALEDKLQLKVNSYNGGVSANESMHSINILLNKVLPMKPTIVVMMHNINDLAMLRLHGHYWYQNSLKSHVQTAKNIYTRYEYLASKEGVTPSEIKESFRKNLETFIAISKVHEIKPVLMTQANRVENDPLYQELNQLIREVGKAQGVMVIDLAANVPTGLEYMMDSYHYTAKGSQKVAEYISAQLESTLQSS